MPRTYPDPWPDTQEGVRKWEIDNGYDFLLERLELPEQLFSKNPCSLDGIALTMIVLGALAEFYGEYESVITSTPPPSEKAFGDDLKRFRRIMLRFCPSFDNRLSIPELARALKSATKGKLFTASDMLDPMLQNFKIRELHQARQTTEDPTVAEFKVWARKAKFSPPEMLFKYDYAGLLFMYYRSSVIHELRVANGREAVGHLEGLFREPDPIFYTNQSDESPRGIYDRMRIGFRPLSILAWAKEAIENARVWAHKEDVHIFPH
jgi:hypothetical protein